MTGRASDFFADLNPSLSDLADVLEAIDEAGAEESAGMLPDGGEDYGPWDDSAQLSAGEYDAIGLAGDFGELGELVDAAGHTEAQRIAEDAEDRLARRPLMEDKIARALDRLSRGTYLPPPMYRDRDEAGQFAPNGCGPLDDFGRCSSRYHSGECFETVRSSAATGDYDAALAWRRALNRGTPAMAAMMLANAMGEPEPGPADRRTYLGMRRILGLGGAA